MVDDVEKARKKLIKLLKTIKTLDDMKKHKDDILAHMVAVPKAAVSELKKLSEKAESMTPEDIEKAMEKFADEKYIFAPEIDLEFERVDKIPGVLDYSDSIGEEEIQKMLEPYMVEYHELMLDIVGKYATDAMKEMMGIMVDGMSEMAEGMMEGMMGEEDDDHEGIKPEPYESREDLSSLNFVYDLVSLDEFKENKTWILDDIEDTLKGDLEGLETQLEMDFPKEDIQKDLEAAEKHRTIHLSELERQFKRLGTIPDGEDEAKLALKEMKTRTKPLADKIKKFGEEFNK